MSCVLVNLTLANGAVIQTCPSLVGVERLFSFPYILVVLVLGLLAVMVFVWNLSEQKGGLEKP